MNVITGLQWISDDFVSNISRVRSIVLKLMQQSCNKNSLSVEVTCCKPAVKPLIYKDLSISLNVRSFSAIALRVF